MTVPVEETPEEIERRYGVTVEDVRELASHVYPNPIATDPHFGDDPMDPRITDTMVEKWIDRVADSVRSRVVVLSQYQSNTGRWAAIVGSARTAVTNGAAYYVVAAAYPTRAGTNDMSSAAADLRSRYDGELEYLSETLPKLFIDQDAGGVVDPVEGTVGVSPLIGGGPSAIPESLFYHSPYREVGYWDPNRMPPAPGAERY